MGQSRNFRLYIIGKKEREAQEQVLTIFAEYDSARALARVKLEKERFSGLIERVRNLKSFVEAGAPPFEREALEELGKQLLEVVLTARIRDLFLLATGERASGSILPLEIIAEDPEIAAWPWEYLFDANTDSFLSRNFHPISRSIFTSNRPAFCGPIEGKVRLLIILGVPPDDQDTTPEEEIKHIEEVFLTYLDESSFDISILDADNYKHLLNVLNTEGPFHIVHYFGHAGFDLKERQGYLSLRRSITRDSFRVGATEFAQVLRDRGIRMVFLNACKTAASSPTESPARSSIAGALVDRGIPAVVASQFSLPDVSAHFLASTIYNVLLTGKPIGQAMRDGRTSMNFADAAKHFDWGIPVLYSTDPSQIILPNLGPKPTWSSKFTRAAGKNNLLQTLARTSLKAEPSIVSERTRTGKKEVKYTVALVDIDTKVGFLPTLVQQANAAQDYYHFEVAYLPVPSGYVRVDLAPDPQTYIPRLATEVSAWPRLLLANYVCFLTGNMIATDEGGLTYWNLFGASVPGIDNVLGISTFEVREYAKEAGVSFAKAVLMLSLSMLLQADPRWNIRSHVKTYGCLFDFCGDRADIIVGLKKMRFDHQDCRNKIRDADQLAAIDALTALNTDRA